MSILFEFIIFFISFICLFFVNNNEIRHKSFHNFNNNFIMLRIILNLIELLSSVYKIIIMERISFYSVIWSLTKVADHILFNSASNFQKQLIFQFPDSDLHFSTFSATQSLITNAINTYSKSLSVCLFRLHFLTDEPIFVIFFQVCAAQKHQFKDICLLSKCFCS